MGSLYDFWYLQVNLQLSQKLFLQKVEFLLEIRNQIYTIPSICVAISECYHCPSQNTPQTSTHPCIPGDPTRCALPPDGELHQSRTCVFLSSISTKATSSISLPWFFLTHLVHVEVSRDSVLCCSHLVSSRLQMPPLYWWLPNRPCVPTHVYLIQLSPSNLNPSISLTSQVTPIPHWTHLIPLTRAPPHSSWMPPHVPLFRS